MPNEQLYRELQNLERKIQLVLNDNKKLKSDLASISEENKTLKAKMEDQMSNISSVQNQMKINKLANNMVVSEADSSELREKIDGYIREIDKCIAHLAE